MISRINKTKCKVALFYIAVAFLGTARMLNQYGRRINRIELGR